MRYIIISDEQLELIVKPFLDRFFDDSEIMASYYEGETWFGIFSDGELLIGHPANDYENDMWYYNGEILGHGADMFSIGFDEWSRVIKKYLNKRYPQLDIKRVS